MLKSQILAALACSVVVAGVTLGQTATTPPVGFVKLAALGSSDTLVSTPLERAPEYVGVVSGVSDDVITVQGATDWNANQFLYEPGIQSKTYCVRFVSGARAGAYFTVLGNTANTLTIDPNGEILSKVTAGDKLQITPYWTIGTLFPSGDEGISFIASTSTSSYSTELRFTAADAIGINLRLP